MPAGRFRGLGTAVMRRPLVVFAQVASSKVQTTAVARLPVNITGDSMNYQQIRRGFGKSPHNSKGRFATRPKTRHSRLDRESRGRDARGFETCRSCLSAEWVWMHHPRFRRNVLRGNDGSCVDFTSGSDADQRIVTTALVPRALPTWRSGETGWAIARYRRGDSTRVPSTTLRPCSCAFRNTERPVLCICVRLGSTGKNPSRQPSSSSPGCLSSYCTNGTPERCCRRCLVLLALAKLDDLHPLSVCGRSIHKRAALSFEPWHRPRGSAATSFRTNTRYKIVSKRTSRVGRIFASLPLERHVRRKDLHRRTRFALERF